MARRKRWARPDAPEPAVIERTIETTEEAEQSADPVVDVEAELPEAAPLVVPPPASAEPPPTSTPVQSVPVPGNPMVRVLGPGGLMAATGLHAAGSTLRLPRAEADELARAGVVEIL